MKKIKGLLCTSLLVFIGAMLAVTAAAASDGSIKVKNAVNGEKYTAYKVFDLTYKGDGETETSTAPYDNVSYSYTKSGESDAFYTALTDSGSVFSVSGTAVKLKDGVNDTAMLTWLKNNIDKLPSDRAMTTVTASNQEASWTELSYGYYYITGTLGSAVMVDSTLKAVMVEEKNLLPTLTKKQSLTGSGYADTDLAVSIGDTVYYEITVTDEGGTMNQTATITDTLSDGLTNQKDYTVKKKSGSTETDLTASSDYTVTSETDRGFVMELSKALTESLSEGDSVVITYSALVNTNAQTSVENGNGANTNTVTLEYSYQTSAASSAISDSTKVTCYGLGLVKTDKDGKVITGAKFKIYDAKTGGNEIPVVKVSEGVYRHAASGETGVEIEAGNVVIMGFETGKIYFEETQEPSGYNRLSERIEYEVTDDNPATVSEDKYASGGLQVINQTGSELPSTGGSGTKIMIEIGIVTMLAAGLVLVTDKRIKKEMH